MMKNEDKTKDQLINELMEVRQRITELKAAETERKKADERFKLAAESGSDLIYEWTLADDTLEWFGGVDAALGYTPAEIPRTIEGWVRLIHPEDLERLKDSV